MAYWFGRFSFLNSSAVMCAGSLAPGCRILGIFATRSQVEFCPCMSFGKLGLSTLASWGTLGRSWDIGEHKKGHFEIQAWIFIDF